MSKIYVDLEELENLFSLYAIPYTNIFDELTHIHAEEIASTMSPLDLKQVLDSKDEVFATQVWTKEDVMAGMRALNIEPDEGAIAEIMQAAKGPLEDCSDNWDRLHGIIKQTMKGDSTR